MYRSKKWPRLALALLLANKEKIVDFLIHLAVFVVVFVKISRFLGNFFVRSKINNLAFRDVNRQRAGGKREIFYFIIFLLISFKVNKSSLPHFFFAFKLKLLYFLFCFIMNIL